MCALNHYPLSVRIPLTSGYALKGCGSPQQESQQPPAFPAGPVPSPWDVWHSEGKRAVGKGNGGEACQGRATQQSISAGDQDSRAKLRAGDLSKRVSVVWAAGSGITAQQELFFLFFLSDRRH